MEDDNNREFSEEEMAQLPSTGIAGGGRKGKSYYNPFTVDKQKLRSSPKSPKTTSEEPKRPTNGNGSQVKPPKEFKDTQEAIDYLLEKIRDPRGPLADNELGNPRDNDAPMTVRTTRMTNSNTYIGNRTRAIELITDSMSTIDLHTLATIVSTIDAYKRASSTSLPILMKSKIPKLESALREELYSKISGQKPEQTIPPLTEPPLESIADLAFALAGNGVPEEMREAVYDQRKTLRSYLFEKLGESPENLQRLARSTLDFIARPQPLEDYDARHGLQTEENPQETDPKTHGQENCSLFESQKAAMTYLGSYVMGTLEVNPKRLRPSILANILTEVKLAKETQNLRDPLNQLEQDLQTELFSRYETGTINLEHMRTIAMVGLAYTLTQGHTPAQIRDQFYKLREEICKELRLRAEDPGHADELVNAAINYLTRTPLRD